jgi:hypothetical protein
MGTLKLITKFSVTHNSLFCECLLSGNLVSTSSVGHYHGIIQEHERKEEHFHSDDKEVLSVHTNIHTYVHTYVHTHNLFISELSQNDDTSAVSHKHTRNMIQQCYR